MLLKSTFEHLGNTLTDKNITYVFNNVILYKPKGEKQFTKIGNVSNTGMDHKNPSWIGKEFDPTRRSHYLLNDDLFGGGYVPSRRFGGSMSSYESGGETNGISLDSMGIDALSALMLPKYVDYINGVDESEEARRVYDKLNRKVYAYAKKGGMTAPNYIASNILKLGGSV